jgi:hypothetical protein
MALPADIWDVDMIITIWTGPPVAFVAVPLTFTTRDGRA